MLRSQHTGQEFWSLRQRKRLRWTLGLFSIGLIVPLAFLFPRIFLQVKTQAFNENYLRVKTVTRHLTRELDHLERSGQQKPAGQSVAGLLEQLIRKKFYESKFSHTGQLLVTHNGEEAFLLEPEPLSFLSQMGWGYTTSPLEEYGNKDYPFFYESRIGAPTYGSIDLRLSLIHI